MLPSAEPDDRPRPGVAQVLRLRRSTSGFARGRLSAPSEDDGVLGEASAAAPARPGVEWPLATGLIAIFAANAVGAVAEPASYLHILEASPLSRMLGLHHHTWAVLLIAVNDGIIAAGLGVSLLFGHRRRMMAIAGIWLAIAALLKLTASMW